VSENAAENNKTYTVGGIQQVGIGVEVLSSAIQWYGRFFGFNALMFHDFNVAELMGPYTGGEVHLRDAALLLNLAGGGGVEVWQYTSRRPIYPIETPILGDLGIFSVVLRTPQVLPSYDSYFASDIYLHSEPKEDPLGLQNFFISDMYGNVFLIREDSSWFLQPKYFPPTENSTARTKNGGISGVIIGVSDIDASLVVYRDLLGYTDVGYDLTGSFEDFENLPGGRNEFRRVLLRKKAEGPFKHLLCDSTIELIQVLDRVPEKIFGGRLWGDIGFIHLCFDVCNMDLLRERSKELGYSFTVDSKETFAMNEASGRFAYIEDNDGTLLEFVETLKIPITKRFHYDIKPKHQEEGLSRLFLRMLQFRSLQWKNNRLKLDF